MTTLSSDAERLACSIKASGQFTPLEELDQAAALLRRIPELKSERDQLRAELEKVRWQPIETAPQDMTECVVVRWVDSEGQEHQDFDYKEDGCWMRWHDHAAHVEVIGGMASATRRHISTTCPSPPPQPHPTQIRKDSDEPARHTDT